MANRGSAARALPEQAEEMNIEERVGRLEVAVQHIQADIAELKTDVRELRKELANLAIEVRSDIQALKLALEKSNARIWIGFVVLLATQILTAGPMPSVLARLLFK